MAFAAALGVDGPARIADAAGLAGSPLLTVAAAAAGVPLLLPSWRRATAAAAHIAGAAAGESPFPPKPNHDSSVPFNPVAEPVLGAAVIIGAVADAGNATGAITGAGSVSEASAMGADTSEFGTGTGAVSTALDSLGDEFDDVEISVVRRELSVVGRSVVALASEPPELWRGLLDGSEVVGRVPVRRLAGGSADVAGETPASDVPRSAAGDSVPALVGSSLALLARLPLRLPRDGELALVEGPLAEAPLVEGPVFEESAADDSALEPAEPVVSATATGTEAIAEPTPNATANAPTRPI